MFILIMNAPTFGIKCEVGLGLVVVTYTLFHKHFYMVAVVNAQQ